MKKYIFLIITIGLLTGCEDYLTTNPSTSSSEDLVFITLDGGEAALLGVYHKLRYATDSPAPYDTYVGLNTCMDAACDDVAATLAGGWLSGWIRQNNAEATISTGIVNRSMFEMYYKVILNANAVINNISQATGNEARKNYVLGQAKAIRALCYFMLVRYYQHPYSVADEELAVPYVDKAELEKKPRETVSYIYDRIEEDLLDAIDLLDGYSREDKNRIDKQVAHGILARVYLTMENFPGAYENANAAREGYPLMTAAEFQSGFNDKSIGEVMWAFSQITEQNLFREVPPQWWANGGRVGTLRTWSWNQLYMDTDFAALFEASDARNQFFSNASDAATTRRSRKFRDVTDNNSDYFLMRAAEMYLIEAEAMVRGGISGSPSATELLNDLQTARGATSTAATIDNIKFERRKELYGEGFRWFDIIRYREALVKDDPLNYLDYIIPAKSNLFRFQIPQREIDYNNAISEDDQNDLEGYWAN